MMSSTSPVEVGFMKNVFLLFLHGKESKVFWEVGIFSTSLEAINVKKLLNWKATFIFATHYEKIDQPQ